MPVARQIRESLKKASWIRTMFQAGLKLKQEKGAENVFDFSLGNPSLLPPPSFQKALSGLVDKRGPDYDGYMPNLGYPGVREAVAGHVSRENGLAFGAEDIVMTAGAAGGINVILKAILEPGAEVIIPSPYFVEYDFYLQNHGGKVVRVPTGPDFKPDPEAIARAITPRTSAVMINSPNNPTGAVYDAQDLAGLARVLDEANAKAGAPIYLISDEPYRQIAFDCREAPGVFGFYRHSMAVTSLSKSHSLPGQRIGYVALHPGIHDKKLLLEAMAFTTRILGFVNACALMQHALPQILDHTVEREKYQAKRDLICDVLQGAGFELSRPGGAFYVFPRCPSRDDVAFCQAALEENLILVPGTGFFGPGHFRAAFCCPDRMIQNSLPAFKRLRQRF